MPGGDLSHWRCRGAQRQMASGRHPHCRAEAWTLGVSPPPGFSGHASQASRPAGNTGAGHGNPLSPSSLSPAVKAGQQPGAPLPHSLAPRPGPRQDTRSRCSSRSWLSGRPPRDQSGVPGAPPTEEPTEGSALFLLMISGGAPIAEAGTSRVTCAHQPLHGASLCPPRPPALLCMSCVGMGRCV